MRQKFEGRERCANSSQENNKNPRSRGFNVVNDGGGRWPFVEGNIASHSGDGIVPTRSGRVGAVESVETEFEPDGKHDRFLTCPRLNWEESVVCFVGIVAKQMALYAQQGHTRII